MCTSRPPAPPPPDPNIALQQQAQKAEATASKKEAKSKQLTSTVSRMRGGKGRRSLIKSSSGGMGFYSEYL